MDRATSNQENDAHALIVRNHKSSMRVIPAKPSLRYTSFDFVLCYETVSGIKSARSAYVRQWAASEWREELR